MLETNVFEYVSLHLFVVVVGGALLLWGVTNFFCRTRRVLGLILLVIGSSVFLYGELTGVGVIPSKW